MSECPGNPQTISDVDIFAPETIENWYPTYDLLRKEAPIYHVPGTKTYFLTRYEDIYHVLRKTEIFRRGAGTSRPLISDPEALETFKKKKKYSQIMRNINTK